LSVIYLNIANGLKKRVFAGRERVKSVKRAKEKHVETTAFGWLFCRYIALPDSASGELPVTSQKSVNYI
jgi:hypothetical protein